MRQSNRNFNISYCAQRVENLTFACVGWGKLNQKFQVSNDFFFRAPKSLTALKHMFDDIEELKGRDVALVSDWLTKKSSKGLY